MVVESYVQWRLEEGSTAARRTEEARQPASKVESCRGKPAQAVSSADESEAGRERRGTHHRLPVVIFLEPAEAEDVEVAVVVLREGGRVLAQVAELWKWEIERSARFVRVRTESENVHPSR
jgi:hypothetical protein